MAWEDIKNRIYSIGSQLNRMVEPVKQAVTSFPTQFQQPIEQARKTIENYQPVNFNYSPPQQGFNYAPQKTAGERMKEKFQQIITRQPQQFVSPLPNEPEARIQPIGQPARPTPTMVPGTANHPYMQTIQRHFPQQEWNKASNVAFGESSFRPNIVHINTPNGGMSVEVKNREQFDDLMRKYGNIDIGLFQLNSRMLAQSKALEQLGLTWYDLFDPEKNAEVASKWVSGQIRGLLPGWQNWATKYATE